MSRHISVRVDLDQVRRNARVIGERVGVPILAVVKCDAYGLGAARVVKTLADVVDGFCVFGLAEAVAAGIWKSTGKVSMTLGPVPGVEADQYIEHRVRPAVWTVERAAALRSARPILSVDTGMQRFSCPPSQVDAVLQAGGCDEAFTHALRPGQVQQLIARVGGRGLRLHAAASALLDEPNARLDAVRPGLALYRGAARVTTALVDVRDTDGPAGYGGFAARRHGIILAGYSNGLRIGPCLVNGRRSRVLEVGMQSAYVEAADSDRTGDEVTLLGDGVTEVELGTASGTSAQDALLRLASAGERSYAGD
jgi:alanine racemase